MRSPLTITRIKKERGHFKVDVQNGISSEIKEDSSIIAMRKGETHTTTAQDLQVGDQLIGYNK